MARISDLPLRHRLFLAVYPYRRIDPVPWTAPAGPLVRMRVAVVTTAGLHLPSDPPFDPGVPGGDASFRTIPLPPDGAPLASLGLLGSHRSTAFDPSGLAADPNVALPLDRLRELAAEGRVGEVAPRHLSFMGSITAPGRLRTRSAPEAAALLRGDGVDAALLVPV